MSLDLSGAHLAVILFLCSSGRGEGNLLLQSEAEKQTEKQHCWLPDLKAPSEEVDFVVGVPDRDLGDDLASDPGPGRVGGPLGDLILTIVDVQPNFVLHPFDLKEKRNCVTGRVDKRNKFSQYEIFQ